MQCFCLDCSCNAADRSCACDSRFAHRCHPVGDLGDGASFRAWSAVRLYYHQTEQDRSKVAALADVNSMLGDSKLRDVKTAFWQCYKLLFPRSHPSDAVVSCLSRELNKRMLCIFNIWKVKNLQLQLTTIQTKRKLGENLYTDEVAAEEVVSKDSETYLDKLRTLMPAYALAGASLLVGVTNPTKEKTLGSNSRSLSRCLSMWSWPAGSEPSGLPAPSRPSSDFHGSRCVTPISARAASNYVVTPALSRGSRSPTSAGPTSMASWSPE